MELIILVIGVLTTKSFSGQIPFIVELGKALQAEVLETRRLGRPSRGSSP